MSLLLRTPFAETGLVISEVGPQSDPKETITTVSHQVI